MENEMLQRVAKAVAAELDRVPMVDASPGRIREIRSEKIARAAIEAMRELLLKAREQLDVSGDFLADAGYFRRAEDAYEVRDMIDAALEPQNTEA